MFPETLLLSDSIVKHIIGWELSQQTGAQPEIF